MHAARTDERPDLALDPARGAARDPGAPSALGSPSALRAPGALSALDGASVPRARGLSCLTTTLAAAALALPMAPRAAHGQASNATVPAKAAAPSPADRPTPPAAPPDVTPATGAPSTGAPPAAPAVSTLPLVGLSAPARVSFDALDIPLIETASFEDALRVEGFLHARNRFAQMDLMRRHAAGELCELVGPLAVSIDTPRARLQLRKVAKASVERLRAEERTLLDAYVDGVNQGLRSLPKAPAEYALLQLAPAPWTADDTMLVALSMCSMLNDTARIETSIGAAAAALPPALFAFLATPYTSFDCTVLADATPFVPPPIPGADVLDTRVRPAEAPPVPEKKRGRAEPSVDDAFAAAATWSETAGGGDGGTALARLERIADGIRAGSNGWVVSGAHTPHGAAILANDMHLPITAPPIWYRASFAYDESGTRRTLDGLTLAGVPGLITGSNGHIAWGFTNVEGDFIDFVVIEPDPNDATKYLVPGGSEPFVVEKLSLKPRAVPAQKIEVRSTRYGPIVGNDANGRPIALRWTALDEGSINLASLDLARATDVPTALDIAARWRGPQQNVMVAGADGRIGWTISGAIPVRRGHTGATPVSWSDGTNGWVGYMGDRAEPGAPPLPARPRALDPEDGLIVTANQRTVPLDVAAVIGTLWAAPDRADRIRDLLRETAAGRAAGARGTIDEARCAAIQLDTEVPLLVRWRDAVTPLLARAGKDVAADGAPTDRARRLAAIAGTLEAWNGRADTTETAVGLVDGMRRRLRRAILAGIAEAAIASATPPLPDAARAKLVDTVSRLPAQDESLLRLVLEQPPHLLPASAASWSALVEQAALESAASMRKDDALIAWGRLNVSDFGHPLAQAIPALASRFMLPTHEQPGHPGAVRVATPTFSASARMVVAPGREAEGLMQMPGGQSGDPGSAHWADQHPAWRDGRPQPLRPGAPVTILDLTPTSPPEGDAGPEKRQPGAEENGPAHGHENPGMNEDANEDVKTQNLKKPPTT
jgi:penicillin amidase